MTMAPVFLILSGDGEYQVGADSFNYVTGLELSQMHNGKYHPVVYLYKALNNVECNYDIYEKEMLAVI